MFSRRGHAQRPRGRHTHTLGRSADMHRSEGGIGRVREAHGRPTRTAERATPPSGSDHTHILRTPRRPPNARNPGSAAQTERQSWREQQGARTAPRTKAWQIFRARARAGARSQVPGREGLELFPLRSSLSSLSASCHSKVSRCSSPVTDLVEEGAGSGDDGLSCKALSSGVSSLSGSIAAGSTSVGFAFLGLFMPMPLLRYPLIGDRDLHLRERSAECEWTVQRTRVVSSALSMSGALNTARRRTPRIRRQAAPRLPALCKTLQLAVTLCEFAQIPVRFTWATVHLVRAFPRALV
jgi:hypothetical protein